MNKNKIFTMIIAVLSTNAMIAPNSQYTSEVPTKTLGLRARPGYGIRQTLPMPAIYEEGMSLREEIDNGKAKLRRSIAELERLLEETKPLPSRKQRPAELKDAQALFAAWEKKLNSTQPTTRFNPQPY